MLEGLPYVAILLLLLLLLLVLFLILLFIFLFLLCASRLSTRQSKVDGTLWPGDLSRKSFRDARAGPGAIISLIKRNSLTRAVLPCI